MEPRAVVVLDELDRLPDGERVHVMSQSDTRVARGVAAHRGATTTLVISPAASPRAGASLTRLRAGPAARSTPANTRQHIQILLGQQPGKVGKTSATCGRWLGP
jgi:hypothetical protein